MPAAATSTAIAAGGRAIAGCADGGERGKFLGQFLRAAMRAFRAPPVAGSDEDFAVALALPAMKFVNRHGRNVAADVSRLKPISGRTHARCCENRGGNCSRFQRTKAASLVSSKNCSIGDSTRPSQKKHIRVALVTGKYVSAFYKSGCFFTHKPSPAVKTIVMAIISPIAYLCAAIVGVKNSVKRFLKLLLDKNTF